MKRLNNLRKKNNSFSIPCGWSTCEAKFRNELQLNGHIAEHLKECGIGPYHCPWSDCEIITSDLKEFERHAYYHGYYDKLVINGRQDCDAYPNLPKCCIVVKEESKVPILKSDFCCGWFGCYCTFASIVEFQDHILQHATFEYEIEKTPAEPRPKIQCKWNSCNKLLDNKYRFIEHIQTHSQKKNTACCHCGEMFRTKTTLFDHLRRQPDNNTHKYQCTHCLKFFATEKLLRCHVGKHLNCYKCSLCDMTCSSASALTTHVRYRHLKDRPIKCSKCDHQCVRPSDLDKHMQFVHLNKVHRCDHFGCNYAVRSYNFLRRHYLEVHENSPFIYICHCCDKPFKSGKSLSMHLVKAHEFQLPSGHKRFIYRIDENGFYRLETMRIESLEVTKQILSPNPFDVAEITEDSSCYEIVSLTNEQDERKIVASDAAETRFAGEVVISLPSLET